MARILTLTTLTALRPYRTPTFYYFALTLALFVSACGGGVGGASHDPNPTQTTNSITEVVAGTGPIVAVRVGETAVLESDAFTNSSDPLTYQWTFSYKPDTSNAELQNATTASPSFVPDVRGTYMAQLVASAGGISSQRSIQLVVATIDPERLTGPVFHVGLSSKCANCHNEAFSTIPGKPQDHIATSNACESCHTPLGFSGGPYTDHQEVFGNCSECHDGVLAIGKSESHAPTTAECNECHNTTNFLMLAADGSFDHSGILRACSGCHDGTISTGKPPSPPHPDTNSECNACHTTVSFLGAFPDHTGPDVVGKRCDSCHGVSAMGQPSGHPQTFVDCGTCHRTSTFSLDGVFNHSVVDPAVQPCESCHNDTTTIGAPSKSAAVPTHPVTTEDCAACHNTESFAGAFIDHTGIVDNCASCHGVSAVGKPVNHMPTTEDCSVCHTPGTFTTGTYDHAGVVNNCESCHDNVISVGKLINHLPTTRDCADCHNTTTFTGATFDHVGIDTSDCASCHNGEISIGKTANHVPTSLDCSACHDIGNFSTFAGITFNHAGIDPNDCASCHDTGIATPKKVNHLPTQDDCSVCHDSTDTFLSTTFVTTIHPDITRGCEGCHNTTVFPATPGVVKSATHLPTDQDCNICHTVNAFTPSIFSHVGIFENCASCHDGSPDFVLLGARGQTDIPIHQNTSGDCSVCHNTTNFADAFVDHASADVLGKRCDSCHDGITATGKDAKPDHVMTTQDCGVCHVAGGTFATAVFDHTGIVDNCASCHNGVDAIGKDAKVDPPHIPTTEDCSACHTPTSFAGATFDHQGIVDNCASCHDGIAATGKAFNHVPSNEDCSVCHMTTGFLPATFSHDGIVDNCASCHDAGFATGKGPDHVATNQDCGVCHNTSAFIPATFDHTGIVDNCASCHGVTATGMGPDHIPTTLDCSNCHTTSTFLGATFDHQGITDGCSSCHDGVTATGSAPQGLNAHFITTEECNSCHSPTGWVPADHTHLANSDYPGDHAVALTCRSCHTNNDQALAYPYSQYAPYCAACHANRFRSEGAHNGGRAGTVEQNKDCSGGGRGCHSVRSRSF